MDDCEQTEVSQLARRSFGSLLVIMTGFTFFSASMMVGQKLGSGLSFGGFMAAMVGANFFLCAYCAALAYIAAKTGLSVHLLARRTFGVRGSFIPSAILAFTQIGWFGVGVAMFAIPTTTLLSGLECLKGTWLMTGDRCLYAVVAVSGALMTSSAFIGIRALHVISVIAVPAIAAFGGYSAVRAMFLDGDGSGWRLLLNHIPDNGIGMTAAISLGIGSFISGGTCTPDFARFARSGRSAAVATVIAFLFGNSLMFFFGAAASVIYGKGDICEVLVLQGLLVPAVLVLGLNIWTTNDNALYTSGLGLANITGLPKRRLVLANGLVGTLAAVWLYSNFCSWLNLLNVFIPPCGAIILVDGFMVGGRKTKGGAAILALLLGSLVSLASFGYLPGIRLEFGIPALNGMLVSAIVFAIATCRPFSRRPYNVTRDAIDATEIK